MNYQDGEILVVEILETVNGFSTTNVGRGSKWKLLRSGKSDHYAVARKGAYTETFFTNTGKQQSFRTIIEVLQRVKENLDDRYNELLDYADAITEALDTKRTLGNITVSNILRDANVTGGSEVTEIWTQNGTVLEWIKTEIFLDWTGEKYVTFN